MITQSKKRLTPDGKKTTHCLQMSIFQKKTGDLQPLVLDINQKTSSLTLNKNNFEEPLTYTKP